MNSRLNRIAIPVSILLVLAAASYMCASAQEPAEPHWAIHDVARPQPKVVDPGTASTPEKPGQPPSDAVILFDGKDLSPWVSDKDGSPAAWKVENGYMEPAKKTGDIRTKEAFGSCQLHVEWATPSEPKGEGQARGNSGVYLMGKYEVQVLDSFNNVTYADGHAAAIYGQSPPLVNASRGPGQWQTYDIIFHRPLFKDGQTIRPATITIVHNGVLVQDHWVIKGTTRHKVPPSYEPHADKLPLKLQFHGGPVHFRNIWIRELPD